MAQSQRTVGIDKGDLALQLRRQLWNSDLSPRRFLSDNYPLLKSLEQMDETEILHSLKLREVNTLGGEVDAWYEATAATFKIYLSLDEVMERHGIHDDNEHDFCRSPLDLSDGHRKEVIVVEYEGLPPLRLHLKVYNPDYQRRMPRD
ncbi:MAG: hypothetical protein ABIH34_06295 [Nanoarchaeota archaeon]